MAAAEECIGESSYQRRVAAIGCGNARTCGIRSHVLRITSLK